MEAGHGGAGHFLVKKYLLPYSSVQHGILVCTSNDIQLEPKLIPD